MASEFRDVRHVTRRGVAAVLVAALSSVPAAAALTAPEAAGWSRAGAEPAPVTAATVDVDRGVRTARFDRGSMALAGAPNGVAASRSWGSVSAPVGSGPFPLVIVLHGAHAFCTPTASGSTRTFPCAGAEIANHDGLVYLAEALARRGFVAVTVGINAEYAAQKLGAVVGAVAAATIERDVLGPGGVLSATEGSRLLRGVVDPAAIDRSGVVLVGHSRGGAVAAVLGRGDASRRLSLPVRGVELLAPSSDTVDPRLLADVPTTVVLGTCDGDTGVDGADFVSTAMALRLRSPSTLVLVRGATHNATNDLLADEPMVPGRPGCDGAERLRPAAQRSFFESLVPDLARSLLGLPLRRFGVDIRDDQRADDRVGARLRVVRVDPAGARRVAVDAAGTWPPSGATTAGLAVTRCPSGLSSPYRNPGTEPCNRLALSELAGRPASLHLVADPAGGALTVRPSIEAGDVVVIRAYADPLATGAAPTITVDAPGAADAWSASFVLPVPLLGDVVSGNGARRGVVLWSERRVVARSRATSLRVSVSGSASLDLVGIDVVRPSASPPSVSSPAASSAPAAAPTAAPTASRPQS